ncbi:MAG: DUF2878 domain-containing protein [Gammaproteobacteria bacterium]|nr:DUF2878 domain-containing protein [Gammaproteobacteria bacterium]MDH4314878.1 DUF2878 domain-containing protein [Gammaproteobacteria bacterium]MDH5213790.1 DUF2878 domain-containing protein [Gammaproteobacteria bacterium]MDH5502309.1 DUF2878 domain-containing protein [Gammaproteobacteria bacterium]
MNMLINVIAFKIGWLSSVVGVAVEMPLLGPAVIFVAIVLHLRLVGYPLNELLLIIMTGLIGAAVDSIMISAGWLSYPTGTLAAGFSPYWIVAMWMLFATTFNVSFRWLRSRFLLAAAMGAISGPLSYYFGAKFGAVTLNDFSAAMIALAIGWGALMPGLLLLAKRLDGAIPQAEADLVRIPLK